MDMMNPLIQTVCAYNLIIWLSPDCNVPSFFSSLTSDSIESFPRCCQDNQLFSTFENKCVDFDSNLHVNSTQHLESNSKILCGYSSSKFKNWVFRSSGSAYRYFYTYQHNGSTYGGVRTFDGEPDELGTLKDRHYCLVVEKETSKPVLIGCSSMFEETNEVLVTIFSIITFFTVGISHLLIFYTFIVFLAIRELRQEVIDKCFVCFLASYLLLPFCYWFPGFIEGMNSYNSKEPADDFLSGYFYMVTFSWLHVMCIHMYRTITDMNTRHPRCFQYYVVYAMGLPFICQTLYFLHIDSIIFGRQHLSDRQTERNLISNPTFFYKIDVCAIQQMINLFIFVCVGYIIWSKKQQWNQNKNSSKYTHRDHQNEKMFFQLLKLFIIMGLDWSCIFYSIHFGDLLKDNIVLRFIMILIIACPGYFITIIYVHSNEHVMTLYREKLLRRPKRVDNTIYPCKV